jgi:SAM-dependent methyltransferase
VSTGFSSDIGSAAVTAPRAGAGSDRRCIACGGDHRPSHLPGLVACRECGLISADLDISDEELLSLYGKDYFHGNEYFDYVAEQESLRINFRDRIASLRKIIPDLPQRDLFEIGCAYGLFLDEVRPFVRSAAGMDISQDAVRYAHDVLGVAAQQGDYLSFEPPNRFGAVAMWDTVEHLRRPHLFIAKIARDLLPGGFLALTTGDIGSLNARSRGRKWRLIHPPTHLHYFSADTMTTLLERHGFDVVHLSHPGNSRNLRAVLHHVLAIRMQKKGWYEIMKPWRVLDLPLTINLYDIMFVIARQR